MTYAFYENQLSDHFIPKPQKPNLSDHSIPKTQKLNLTKTGFIQMLRNLPNLVSMLIFF